MNKPIRILYLNGGTMDMGGISSYMMNYYRHFDKTKIQVDFIVHGKGGVYDDEIRRLGGQVFHVPTKKENYIENKRKIIRIIREGNYQIVHSHMDGMNGLSLRLAKKCGVKIRISHSHNTNHLTNNKLKLLVHEFIKKSIPKYATELWACSDAAGKWLYGKNDFHVIPNAIEVEKYKYDDNFRRSLRREFDVEGKYVIGHIGKFEYQKNHDFLVRVFDEIVRYDNEVTLMLVGDGTLKEKIQDQVNKLGLKKKVLFLGKRDDVNKIMNVFDIFVLPSHFEGLPVVAVEAQANGLNCICADTITREIDISGNVTFVPLDNNIVQWRDAVCKRKARDPLAEKKLTEKGYNILVEASKLQQLYIQLVMEVH